MKNYIISLIFLLAIFSCSEKEDTVVIDPVPEPEEEIVVECDFTPEIADYDFFIEGVLCDKLIRYQQVNFEWTNVSNKYFIDSQETWLQGYADSTDLSLGYWKIRISDTDIENLDFPHSVGFLFGGLTWYDPRVDDIIENTDFCQGPDSGCTFAMRAGDNGNELIVTSNEDNIIEGEFSGRAIVVGTGFLPYRDSTLYYDITDGKFRIKYRTE